MRKIGTEGDSASLRINVFYALREAILVGEFPPGARLMETHLAKKLDVSRTPVREAIRMLEHEGLVIMIPRRGAQVAAITEEDLKDVLEVRTSLDILAVELACKRIVNEDFNELIIAEKKFEEAVNSEDTTLIARTDVEFHKVIFKISRNKRLNEILINLSERMFRYRLEYIKTLNDHQNLVAEHKGLIDCLRARDVEKAVRMATIHVTNQQNAILASLQKNKISK